MNDTKNRRPIRKLPGRSRRGTALYVMVMGVSLIVAAIGLSAITISRTQLRMNFGEQEASRARQLASSAVENALVVINSNPNWRDNLTDSREYPDTPVTLGDGTFTWMLVDPDGSLNDDAADAVRVYGIGRLGQHVCTESVQLEPAGTPLTCLEVSAHAGNDVTFNWATVTGNHIISANNSITGSSSEVGPAVEAVNSISGGNFNGGTTSGITPRTMPDPNGVFDYYIANGTHIDVGSLPKWGGDPDIKNVVLSPAANPFGTGETNPEGIYVIDLMGQGIWIRESRIVATLVLLNSSSSAIVYDKAINWEPAVSNYPALLVDGNMTFQFDSTIQLVEGTNFNPPGTPYQGEEDTVSDDSYPSVIKGLVYVSGDARCNWQHPAFDGVLIVGNTLSVSDYDLGLKYDSTFFNNPPPGFRLGDVLEIMRGSWKRGPVN